MIVQDDDYDEIWLETKPDMPEKVDFLPHLAFDCLEEEFESEKVVNQIKLSTDEDCIETIRDTLEDDLRFVPAEPAMVQNQLFGEPETQRIVSRLEENSENSEIFKIEFFENDFDLANSCVFDANSIHYLIAREAEYMPNPFYFE